MTTHAHPAGTIPTVTASRAVTRRKPAVQSRTGAPSITHKTESCANHGQSVGVHGTPVDWLAWGLETAGFLLLVASVGYMAYVLGAGVQGVTIATVLTGVVLAILEA